MGGCWRGPGCPRSKEDKEEGAASAEGLRGRGFIWGQADPSCWHFHRSVRGLWVSAEQVALIPQCAECLDMWLPDDEDRWHCHAVDDGPDDKLVFYCPECAEHEFGA